MPLLRLCEAAADLSFEAKRESNLAKEEGGEPKHL